MKKFGEMTTITLLAFLMFILHLSAFVARSERLESSDEVASRARPIAPRLQQKSFAGKVVSVNTVAETLIARRKNETSERSFDLTFAKFLRGTRPEQVKVGDSVALKYVVNDGKNFVTFIVAIPPAPGGVRDDGEAKPTENARLGSNGM